MTVDESHEKRQQWIVDYLYGELSAEEKKVFENTLAQDAQLKHAFDEHCSLDSILPRGTQPVIEDARMQGVRWSAFRSLRAPQKLGLWQRFKHFWQAQMSLKTQVLAMAFMFIFGFYINGTLIDSGNNSNVNNTNMASTSSQVNTEPSQNDRLLAVLNEQNYELVDLDLHRYDAAKGEVEFSFALSSQSTIKGNLNNPQVRTLLLRSFNADTQDDVRLQLTNVLGGYTEVEEVQNALINTLLNDPNPGVRYNAVENLVKVAQQPDVRMALLNSLAHDVNPGIRVEAFLATTNKVDAALIQVLKNYSIDDANTFIRERSKRILRELDETGVAPSDNNIHSSDTI